MKRWPLLLALLVEPASLGKETQMSLERMQTAVDGLVETLGFKGAKAGPDTIAEADARNYLTKCVRELRMAVAQGGADVDVTELALAAGDHLGVGADAIELAFQAEVKALGEDAEARPDDAEVFHEDHGFISEAEAQAHAEAAELVRAEGVATRARAAAALDLARAKAALARAQTRMGSAAPK